LSRDQHGIGDDVVHPRRARGAGIAQIVHLDRGDPRREERGAAEGGVAHEVDGDVDALLVGEREDLPVAQVLDVVEGVETPITRLRMPFSGAVLREKPTKRKPAAVVALEEFRHQVHHGMVTEVAREIADDRLLLPPPEVPARHPSAGAMREA